jgi:hypothetical protein
MEIGPNQQREYPCTPPVTRCAYTDIDDVRHTANGITYTGIQWVPTETTYNLPVGATPAGPVRPSI